MAVPATTPHSAPGHDELLMARFVAGDLDDRESASARARLAECAACALLFEDLRAITAATASLPPARRPRDFRLTAEDAARLQQTGLQRVLGWLAGPRAAFTQPLAAGLVTLGIVGVLVSGLSGSFGTAGAAPPAADQAAGAAGRGAYSAAGSNGATGAGGLSAAGAPTAAATALAPNAAATAAPAFAPSGEAASAAPNGPIAASPGATDSRDLAKTPVSPVAAGDGATGSKAGGSAPPAPAVAPGPSGQEEFQFVVMVSPLAVVALASIVSILAGVGLLLARLAARRLG